MRHSRRATIRAIASILLTIQPAVTLHAEQKNVSARPGTPNVWSMEQAHYLLSRLRANKDGLQLKLPSDSDLDPNAVNGLRLDALQSFLKVGAGFNQITGVENRLALDEYKSGTSRRKALLALADARMQEMQARELEQVSLEEERANLQSRLARATDPTEKATLEQAIEAKKARIDAVKGTAAALRVQIDELRAQAAAVPNGGNGTNGNEPAGEGGAKTGEAAANNPQASGLPALKTPPAETADMTRQEMMKDAFTKLFNETASNFRQPRLHASQLLDNFVQMQYEIVAKQLTTLRDEVGKGQRVLFLELPTSIQARAHRKGWIREGGEDRLAQSWWRLKTLYLSYDKSESPCWVQGADVTDGLQLELGGRGGADVDDVPEFLKSQSTLADGRRASLRALEEEIKDVEARITELMKAVVPSAQIGPTWRERREQARQLEKELVQLKRIHQEEYDRASAADISPVQEPRRITAVDLPDYLADLPDGPQTSRTGELVCPEVPAPAGRDRPRLEQLAAHTRHLTCLRRNAYAAWVKYDDAHRKSEEARGEIGRARMLVEEAQHNLVRSLRVPDGAPPKRQSGAPQNRTEPSPFDPGQVAAASTNYAQTIDRLSRDVNVPEYLEQAWRAAESAFRQQASRVRRLQTGILNETSTPTQPLTFGSRTADELVTRLENPCRILQSEAAGRANERREERQELEKAIARASTVEEDQRTNGTNLQNLSNDLERAKMQIGAIRRHEQQLQRDIQRSRGEERSRLQALLKNMESDIKKLSETEAQLSSSIAVLKINTALLVDRKQKRDKQKAQLEHLQAQEEIEGRILLDELEYHQTRIYAAFGGPVRIQHAFRMDLKEDGTVSAPGDRGLVHVIEVLPRQTALNVNSTHALVKGAKLTGALQMLFGLGAKIDYERLREKYDQFMQQEVFASGFGKGNTVFGWTFGPNPGTRVLNPGTRTTYAALTVPSSATGLVVESRGCSYHHNDLGPTEADDKPCSDWTAFSLGLPDRGTAGSFQVREVRYDKVRPGERAAITLHGRFSPETNVLVNGRRLVQVVGLGKPVQHMDFGPKDDPATGFIDGAFEFVNDRNLAVTLNIPSEFRSAKFPRITLISPSRTATINSALLMVNGLPKRLDGEDLLIENRPLLSLESLEILDSTTHFPRVRARLSGDGVSSLKHLYINGAGIDPADIDILSDKHALIWFTPPFQATRLTVSGASAGSPDRRTASSFSIANPLMLYIGEASVKPGSVKYDAKGKPLQADITLTGAAFRPDMHLNVSGASVVKDGYVSETSWNCTVTKPAGEITFFMTGPAATASRSFTIPDKPADPPKTPPEPKPKAKVTEVSIQRTETEK